MLELVQLVVAQGQTALHRSAVRIVLAAAVVFGDGPLGTREWQGGQLFLEVAEVTGQRFHGALARGLDRRHCRPHPRTQPALQLVWLS